MNLIQQLEQEQVAKLTAGKEIPDFQPGDTVIVNVKIVEGDKERIQTFEGVCIARAGDGMQETSSPSAGSPMATASSASSRSTRR